MVALSKAAPVRLLSFGVFMFHLPFRNGLRRRENVGASHTALVSYFAWRKPSLSEIRETSLTIRRISDRVSISANSSAISDARERKFGFSRTVRIALRSACSVGSLVARSIPTPDQ